MSVVEDRGQRTTPTVRPRRNGAGEDRSGMAGPLLTLREALAFLQYCAHSTAPALRDPLIGDPDLDALERAVKKVEMVAPAWRHDPIANVVRVFVGPHFREAHPDWAARGAPWVHLSEVERLLRAKLS